ncbi:hypothetical protein L1049_022678 [Liquidambar formosana]|uniref:Uncharacterized protein n=1 Tax=Liquidambar formosana TaxID=63359 RepID=A0AAP0RDB7_LIQFO
MLGFLWWWWRWWLGQRLREWQQGWWWRNMVKAVAVTAWKVVMRIFVKEMDFFSFCEGWAACRNPIFQVRSLQLASCSSSASSAFDGGDGGGGVGVVLALTAQSIIVMIYILSLLLTVADVYMKWVCKCSSTGWPPSSFFALFFL